MKKWILMWVGVGFLFACSNKEEATVQPPKGQQGTEISNGIPCAGNIQKRCKINGYDCCKIIHLLEKTTTYWDKERELTQYKNPELEKIGLSIAYRQVYMGPYESYQFSNGMKISWHYDPNVLNYRVIEVALTKPNGTKKVFSAD